MNLLLNSIKYTPANGTIEVDVKEDGTGLGLSIVKQIIERHGGKIWEDSREDIGTKFSFTLQKTASNSITLERKN